MFKCANNNTSSHEAVSLDVPKFTDKMITLFRDDIKFVPFPHFFHIEQKAFC